jgi:hypothetical protein
MPPLTIVTTITSSQSANDASTGIGSPYRLKVPGLIITIITEMAINHSAECRYTKWRGALISSAKL